MCLKPKFLLHTSCIAAQSCVFRTSLHTRHMYTAMWYSLSAGLLEMVHNDQSITESKGCIKSLIHHPSHNPAFEPEKLSSPIVPLLVVVAFTVAVVHAVADLPLTPPRVFFSVSQSGLNRSATRCAKSSSSISLWLSCSSSDVKAFTYFDPSGFRRSGWAFAEN